MPSFNRIAARELEAAGNMVSGLSLEEIDEDGHRIAGKLWKIAAYIRSRDEEATRQEETSTEPGG